MSFHGYLARRLASDADGDMIGALRGNNGPAEFTGLFWACAVVLALRPPAAEFCLMLRNLLALQMPCTDLARTCKSLRLFLA